MKKHVSTFSILFMLLLALSGCNLGFEAEKEPRTTLDISKWPTPVPPTVQPQPTAFPISTLPPTVAPTPRPTDTTVVDSAASEPASPLENILAGDTTQLMQAANALGISLSPVATYKVQAAESTIRQGPGSNYAQTAVVEAGELGAVMGQDSTGEWLYTLTITGLRGWIPAADLRIVGSVTEAPVLPPDPIGAMQAQLAAQLGGGKADAVTAGSTGTSAGAAAVAAPLNLTDLTPAATGRVSSALVNLRQRPGSNYQQLGELAKDSEVAIYGLNRDREWALVATAQGDAGWVSMDYLDVTGSLTNAPQYRTLEPASAGGPAPIVPLDGGPAQSIVSASTSGGSGEAAQSAAPAVVDNPPAPAVVDNAPAPPADSDSGPAVPGNTLLPVATANVDEKVDMLIGPAADFGALSTATVDETVTVRAVNPERTWAIIQRPNGKIGWVPLSSLTITNGFLENAQAVTTGIVTSNNLPVTSGPGIYFASVGLVNRNDLVSVLAINPGRNWVLIEPAGGGQGWLQLRLITNFSQSLDALPVVEVDLEAQQARDAGPQPPAPTGAPSGTLVFQKSSGGPIMGINADGTGLRQITQGIDPVLSPDGSLVAFTRWEGDIGTLWVASTDGSGERAVLGEMRKAKGPDWSPDGTQLVLNFQQGGQVDDMDVCRPLGSDIPFGRAANIRVKVNDKGVPEICFILLADPHWMLRVVDANTGKFEDKYGSQYAFRPAWDPAREWRIVSAAGNGLLAIDANNNEYRQQLTDVVGDGSPVFSPDGQFMAVVTDNNGTRDIYRLNADGGGRVRLTQTPLWEGIKPNEDPHQWNNVAPAWSPDGSRIAFLTDRTDRWEVWVMNADGSKQQPLFSDEINDQLNIEYNFVDERTISWR